MKPQKIVAVACCVAALRGVLCLPVEAADIEVPQWIWNSADRESADSATLWKSFTLSKPPRQATLRGLAAFVDVIVYLNGQPVGRIDAFGQRADIDVTRWCKSGENELKLDANKLPGPSAIAVELEMINEDGTRQSLVTDSAWNASTNEQQPTEQAASFGGLGILSWAGRTDELKIEAFDEYNQWKEAQYSSGVENVGKFFVRPGFQLEVVRTASPEEGSWVSMAFDPQGRVVIAREKRGLLRISVAPDAHQTPSEVIDDTLEECRGLLFAFGSLYAHANNSRALYRLRDVNGDDKFEEVKLLARSEGDVGHGRNDLALGPDQKIYVICGDDVLPPAGALSLIPPEQLPPHRNEGFVARTDAEGKHWEVVAHGLRNPYGLAFNTDRELFTFDADMELDLGCPYYRPTGVFQIASGSDYGWRRSPHPNPQYLPDTLPHTLTIGKSSPTSIAFGTESRFPEPYRHALYLLDWSYGRIIAVHMRPRGAGYVCRGEVFLRGRPLNVTDLAFGPDGAMYFTTGGRGTQSALYRAVEEKTSLTDELLAQATALRAQAAEARSLKRQLESFHGKQDAAAIDIAWAQLANHDPFIAHAARVALEHQPAVDWKDRAFGEPDLGTGLIAQLALSRVAPTEHLSGIVSHLNSINAKTLSLQHQLVMVRTYEICHARQPLSAAHAEKTRNQLESLIPCAATALNRDVAGILVTLDSPLAVEKALALAAIATTPEESLHYVFVLRNAKSGWTEAARRNYFTRLSDWERTEKHNVHMTGFLGRTKNDALARLTDAERAAIADLITPSPAAPSEAPPTPRTLVKNWKLADFADLLGDLAKAGQPQVGGEIFRAANCARCHRCGDIGRGLGPDLSHVANRFGPADILLHILEPSKAVDEKYRSISLSTTDGEIITGQIITDDYRESLLRIATDPLNPAQTVAVPKAKIDRYQATNTSIMPTGLLDTFTRDEIASLIAYLSSPPDPQGGK